MKKKLRSNLLVFCDIILVNISMMLALYLRFDSELTDIVEKLAGSIIYVAIAATIIKIICYALFKLYNSLWEYAGIYEMVCIGGAALISNSAVLACVLLFWPDFSKSVFIITAFTDITLIAGSRFAYRIFRRVLNGEFTQLDCSKRILIVGGGEAGALVIKELKMNPDLRSIPAAIIDDDRAKTGKKLNGVPVVGTGESIVETTHLYKIDEIIVAIPSAGKKAINRILQECTKTSCKVKILPSVCQLIDGTVNMKMVRDVDIEDLLGRESIKVDLNEITEYIENQIVLVTGGGGSIGSELCRQIAGFRPKTLIILDNYENSLYEIHNELVHRNTGIDLVAVIANIREKSRLENIFRRYRPDIVFHAAAHKHVPLMEGNPTEAIKNNVFGTLNVVECADKYGAGRFIQISTDKAVNPTNIMGATKRIGEMIIQATNKHSKTNFAAVRFGNVLGSNGSVIPVFKKQIEQGGPVTVTHPEVTRYFMTIPEAVQLVIQAGAMAKGGEVFVLDMGQPVKIYDLARNLIKLSGFEPDEDIKIEITGLRPGEKLYEELLMAEEGLQATKNEKIFVAPPIFTDLAILRREISVLNEIILGNTDELLEYIKIIVPTFNRPQHVKISGD